MSELWNLTHGNSNRFVSLAIKTTGGDPREHELAQICIFPLNSKLELSRETIPFYVDIRPLKDNFQGGKGYLSKDKYEQIKKTADSPQKMAELFDKWLEDKIRLAPGKKLIPITHDWPLKRVFIKKWLGPINFNDCFGPEYRDLISIAGYCNDFADFHTYQLPYPKLKLAFIASVLGVEFDRFDETIAHTQSIVECYKRMMRKMLPALA